MVDVAAAQANWIVASAYVDLLRYAGFLDKGSRNLPSAGDGLNQSLTLVEDGQVVDIVGVDDVTAIVCARTLVVLDIPRVVDFVAILRLDVDDVRVRVIDLAAQAPAVLDANSGLEAVVVAGGDVFILGDARVTRVLTVGVHAAEVVESCRGVRTVFTAAVTRYLACVNAGRRRSCARGCRAGANIHQANVGRQAVERVVDNVLMPLQVANVLGSPNDRRRQFTLQAEAVHGHGGSSEGLGNAIAGARKDQRRRRDHIAGAPVLPRGAEVGVANAERRIEGRAGCHAEDVVALHALIEGSKAAAENGLAVSEEILGEADARLPRFVVVGDNSHRVALLAGKVGAVDVRGDTAEGIQSRAG